jgi:hypothetical protein
MAAATGRQLTPFSDRHEEPVSAIESEAHHRAIELIAYYYWEQRGCPWGTPEEDWFRAEEDYFRVQKKTAPW